MSFQPPRKKLKHSKITSFIGGRQLGAHHSSLNMQSGNQSHPKCSFSKIDDKVIIEMPPDIDNYEVDHTSKAEKNYIEPNLQPIQPYNVDRSISIPCDKPAASLEKESSFPSSPTKDSTYTMGVQESSSMKGSSTSKKAMVSYKGYPLESFVQLSHENLCIPKLESSATHDVFVKLPLPERGIPEPVCTDEDLWDDKHVKMPNSPESLYHNVEQNGKLIERWAVICEAFSVKITSIEQLKDAILSYNHRYKQKWSFSGLRKLIEVEFCEEEETFFFQSVLPGIIRLALALPSIVAKPIPLLRRGKTHSLSMSQKQVSSLLANAFLCTFPRRNVKGPHTEYATFPDINFYRLFNHQDKKAYEKLKCIIHYFKEITNKDPDGIITYTRQCINSDDLPFFDCEEKLFSKLHIDSKGLIEEADGLLQVDFANKYIGGGVLGLGSVQEEIRFVVYPELLITRLFTEVLSNNEALFITGAERFNNVSGYASTFKWTGPYYDVTPRDPHLRRLCQLVGIDATNFTRNMTSQYQPYFIMRELKKAYVGFCSLDGSNGIPSAVATGNWGCGAFRGNPMLKGLLQLIAASKAGRDVAYFTFGDDKLRDQLYDIYQFLESSGASIGTVFKLLCKYGKRKDIIGNDIAQYIKEGIYEDFN